MEDKGSKVIANIVSSDLSQPVCVGGVGGGIVLFPRIAGLEVECTRLHERLLKTPFSSSNSTPRATS